MTDHHLRFSPPSQAAHLRRLLDQCPERLRHAAPEEGCRRSSKVPGRERPRGICGRRRHALACWHCGSIPSCRRCTARAPVRNAIEVEYRTQWLVPSLAAPDVEVPAQIEVLGAADARDGLGLSAHVACDPGKRRAWVQHRKPGNRGDCDRGDRVAIAEDRKKGAECRFDQSPVKGISAAGADKVAKCRQEPEIIAEPGLGIGANTRVEVGFVSGERLEYARQKIHCARGDRRQACMLYFELGLLGLARAGSPKAVPGVPINGPVLAGRQL